MKSGGTATSAPARGASLRHVGAVRLTAVAMSAGYVICLSFLGKNLFFLDDEWDFILRGRSFGLVSLLEPHNEHWSTIPIVVYKILLNQFGITSYQPYMVTLAITGAACGLALFELVRIRAGIWAALFSLILFLCLGRGAENSLWAFQIGWVAAMTFGLVGMLLLECETPGAGRLALASAAFLLSVMSSGVSLLFCWAVLVELTFDRRRRRSLVALVTPLAAYLAWEIAFGSRAIHASTDIVGTLLYARSGIGSALTGALGLPLEAGDECIFGLVLLLSTYALLRQAADARVIGAAAAILGEFMLFSLVRAHQFGAIQATAPRYVDTGAIFLMLLLMPILFNHAYGLIRNLHRPAVILALGLIPVLSNLLSFATYYQVRLGVANRLRTEVATVAAVRAAPGLRHNASIDPQDLPRLTPETFYLAEGEFGSPIGYPTTGDLGGLPPGDVDRTLFRIFMPETGYVSGRLSESSPGSCQRYPTGRFDDLVRGRQSLLLSVDAPSHLTVWLSVLSAPSLVAERQIGPGAMSAVVLPNMGGALEWHVIARIMSGAALMVCRGG
ncbi:MAG: hypothetical protein ACR2MY_12950 [Candidatus Dormibacteria bacterium]